MGRKKRLILFSILIIISLIAIYKVRNYMYINQINKNLNMGEIKLLVKEQDIKNMLEQQFTPEKGFGCRGYSNNKDGIDITFSGFPDVLDKYVLTDIETTNRQHSLYDISVGESIDRAIQILQEKGFKNNGQLTFKKGAAVVSLYSNAEAKIEKISIRLSSTNKMKVVF